MNDEQMREYAKKGGLAKHDSKREPDNDRPWEGLMPVKRYKYHTVFLRRSRSGEFYMESYLNIDIDRGKKTSENE